MINIKKDIENRTFKRVYLLFGSESFLVNEYRDRLKKAVMGDSDNNMNYALYNGNNGFDERELTDSLMQFPFLSEFRLVVLEESGLFSRDNDFDEVIGQIPDSTVLIMIEKDVDKRKRLYKAIQKYGYAAEFSTPKPEELEMIVGAMFKDASKKISSHLVSFFVEYVGGDLYNLKNEADKLSDYIGDRAEITQRDIEAICSMQISNRIYDIADNLMAHNTSEAMKMYFDLIALREAPLGILRRMMAQYNSFLLVKDGMDRGQTDAGIASETKMPPWMVRRNRAKLRNITRGQLLRSLVLMINTEENIKTGKLGENTGMEIMLANLSAV